jgi:hypothetical protein
MPRRLVLIAYHKGNRHHRSLRSTERYSDTLLVFPARKLAMNSGVLVR